MKLYMIVLIGIVALTSIIVLSNLYASYIWGGDCEGYIFLDGLNKSLSSKEDVYSAFKEYMETKPKFNVSERDWSLEYIERKGLSISDIRATQITIEENQPINAWLVGGRFFVTEQGKIYFPKLCG